MVRHSLQEAVAAHDRGRASTAAARRVWIDNPYVAAKVALVQAVAQANLCRAVWMKDLGCVVTVGAETDLHLVAYATRIGERLAATSSTATDELRRDDRLLPVLAARNGGRRNVHPAVSENGCQLADGLGLRRPGRRALGGGHGEARRPRLDRGLTARRPTEPTRAVRAFCSDVRSVNIMCATWPLPCSGRTMEVTSPSERSTRDSFTAGNGATPETALVTGPDVAAAARNPGWR